MNKTPEDIKKGLVCCSYNTYYCGNDCPYLDGCHVLNEFKQVERDALAYIQQLEKINADFAERTARLEAQIPKWISVDVRLPKDDVNVLVYAIGNNENDVIAMTSYTHNMLCYGIEGWRSPWQYFFHEYKITHWMPLPESPKEG